MDRPLSKRRESNLLYVEGHKSCLSHSLLQGFVQFSLNEAKREFSFVHDDARSHRGIKLRIHSHKSADRSTVPNFSYWSSELGFKADCLFPDSKEMELTGEEWAWSVQEPPVLRESLWSTGTADLSLDIQLGNALKTNSVLKLE